MVTLEDWPAMVAGTTAQISPACAKMSGAAVWSKYTEVVGTVPVESYCDRVGSKRHRHAPRIRTISPGAVPKIWAYGRSGLMNRASNVSKLAALMKAA